MEELHGLESGMLLERSKKSEIENALGKFSAVGIIGPRQIGKTTLAHILTNHISSVYLDLESPVDRAKLTDPISYFEQHNDKLMILDEIQTQPEIFQVLRGIIDSRRRDGFKYGQFLILGSASIELLKQSSESLAGRIKYIEMTPLTLIEISNTSYTLNELWLRGGFPDSLIVEDDSMSIDWRHAFIKTYLERDIPQLGPKIPAETLRRFWTMLAYCHGSLLNASKLATSLGISGQSVARYIDLFVDLFLLRRLQPWHSNTGKRLTKSPKIYLRDSGIVHALLNIKDLDQLSGNPIIGASWEGFVIENIINTIEVSLEYSFYRSNAGAEIDLIITLPNGEHIAIEIKYSRTPSVSRGYFEACKDVKPVAKYVVYTGNERFTLTQDVVAIPLATLIKELQQMTK